MGDPFVMAELSSSNDAQVSAGTITRLEARHCLWPDERSIRAQTLFRDIPMFRDVPPHHLRQIAQFAHSHTFTAGEAIIREGEIGEIEISASLVDRARELPHLDVDPDGHELAFDADGRITDVWGSLVGAGH